MDLYGRIKVSDLLIVEDYKTQAAQNKPLNYKVSLNPSNPKSIVRLIPEDENGGPHDSSFSLSSFSFSRFFASSKMIIPTTLWWSTISPFVTRSCALLMTCSLTSLGLWPTLGQSSESTAPTG